MKKCLGLFFSALIVLGMSACSEDFDVAAPYKDVTVVYGLLNYGDTAQYIRVQKAFMDQNRSALEMAKIPDSSYYRNLEVRMKAIKNGSVVANDLLSLVDLNNEGYPKQPGVFFTGPSYAYKYSKRLDASATYRLLIINKETGNIDSADTRVIDTARSVFGVTELNESKRRVYSIDFSFNNPNSKYALNFSPVPAAASYAEGYIRFNYVNEENGIQKDTFFVWQFASKAVIEGTANDRLEVSTDQIMNAFKTYIPEPRAGQNRYLDSAEVYVWAADANYYNYMVNNQFQGGLTADQVRPNYTTIRGKDVLGVFGSRARCSRTNIPVSDKSVDTLVNNRNTRFLNFKGRSDH